MNGDGAGTGDSPIYPLPPPPMMAAQQQPHRHVHAAPNHHQQQQHRPGPGNNWADNDANTLLVVATLITMLTYQIGSSVPGGYWQDTQAAGDAAGSKPPPPPHTAGDPVMRDLHPERYWVFVVASWVGFAGSMLMTLSLLVRMPVDSRHVRWSFAVAYSSLVLTFRLSQPKTTHVALDILVWVAVTAFLWLMVSARSEHRARIVRFLCCAGDN
ncbi:unnamed protein product [Urochloa humidicola]